MVNWDNDSAVADAIVEDTNSAADIAVTVNIAAVVVAVMAGDSSAAVVTVLAGVGTFYTILKSPDTSLN